MLTKSNYGWLRDGLGSKVAADEINRQLSPVGSLGRTFYVNPAAGGADEADSPFPIIDGIETFASVQEAIDACVDNRGDLIIVKRGWTAITTPILFNKAGIRVVCQEYGIPPQFKGEYFTQDNTTGGAPAAIISKGCHIDGMGFHTAWTGANSHNVQYDSASGEPGWVWLTNCRFVNWAAATEYGLWMDAGANCLIEGCSFEGDYAAPTNFTAGIAFSGSGSNNPIRNWVRHNTFAYCDYAIEHADSTPQEFVYGPGNITMDVGTKFLNSNDAACNGIVCGNFFATAEGAATFDQTVAAMETDGIMCVGNEYSTEGPGP
jgi:hypothetical protein